MAVTYEEVDQSPTIQWDLRSGKWSGKRILLCDWADRIALMEEFLTPFPGVAHPDNAYAYASGASVVPVGKTVDSGDSSISEWTKAKVTIAFSTPGLGDPITQPDGSVISETIDASAEFLTLDHSLFHWESATGPQLKSSEAPGRMSIGFDYVFTRYNVTAVPQVALTLLGWCNEGQMTSAYLGLTFSAEAILYTALALNHRSDSSGNKIDYTMRFSFRPNWNEFWRINKPGGAGFSRIFLADGTAYNNYPLGNLTLL